MSIRLKVLGAIGVTFVIVFVALFAISQTVVRSSFEQLETETSQRNIRRVQNQLQDLVTAQISTNGDWAIWTDTYQFVQGELPEYPDDNLSTDALIVLNLNMMLFMDVSGEIFYSKVVDLEAAEDIPLPTALQAYLTPNDLVVHLQPSTESIGGYLDVDGQLMLVTARPIFNSEREGASMGTLIMGRFFNESQITALAESLQLDLKIYQYSNPDLPADILAERDQLSGSIPQIRTIDENTIEGYALLQDITGTPIGIINITTDRPIYQQGLQTIRLLALALIVTGVALSIATVIVLEFVVVNRVARLSREVDTIQETDQINQQVTVSSNDEVSNLGTNINQMLDRIARSQRQLSENNAELKIAYQKAEEATRTKSQFLSTMSHELRTPLNAIIGYSGIMLEGIGGEIDEDAEDMIVNIKDSSQHLLNLINDILDIAKIESGRMEIVQEKFAVAPMVTLVKDQLEVLARKKNLDFDVDIREDVPPVLIGDKARISQMIINLLSNAFKFTEKGVVGLFVSWDKGLVIRVRDTGIGIPAHALQYIFDEFRQVDDTTHRQHGGTGLGLSIVRKMAIAMGGNVSVESEVGKGTTFTINLPLPIAEGVTDPAGEEYF